MKLNQPTPAPPTTAVKVHGYTSRSCPAYSMLARLNWRTLPRHLAASAFSFARLSAGNSKAARIAMIAMTTSNSMSVNPGLAPENTRFPADSPARFMTVSGDLNFVLTLVAQKTCEAYAIDLQRLNETGFSVVARRGIPFGTCPSPALSPRPCKKADATRGNGPRVRGRADFCGRLGLQLMAARGHRT